MPASRMIVAALVGLAITMGGCSNDLQQRAEMLVDENRDLRDQLNRQGDDLAMLRQQVRDQESTGEVATVQQPLGQATGFEQIPNVTASIDHGEVTVEVESDVLFNSGKTALKQAAKKSLDSVVSVLNRSYSDLPIRIEGHTDSDPIRKSGFKSNYHLGFNRAWAVREYLVSRGVSGERIAVASYGPNDPRTTKAASRRVQIVVAMQ